MVYLYESITGEDKPVAHDINRLVVPKFAAKWRELGEALGLSPEQLDIIFADSPSSCEERCKMVLRKWQSLDPSATWGKLIDASNAISSIAAAGMHL